MMRRLFYRALSRNPYLVLAPLGAVVGVAIAPLFGNEITPGFVALHLGAQAVIAAGCWWWFR